MLLKGKKGLIMGVANNRSIAWGISKKLSEHGAELAFTYVGDALKKRVIPLAESLGSKFTLDCNVENKEQIEVSRFYEKLPKPYAIAVQEWLDNKIYFRDTKSETEQ